MRGSKAKKIRRFAEMTSRKVNMNRTFLTQPVVYKTLKPVRIFARPPFQIRSAVFLGQVKMADNCVRAIYQNMKKRYRLANQFERRMP